MTACQSSWSSPPGISNRISAKRGRCRRLSTVVGVYRYAVVDGDLAESPAEHVRRPKIDTESTTLGLDRMELGTGDLGVMGALVGGGAGNECLDAATSRGRPHSLTGTERPR